MTPTVQNLNAKLSPRPRPKPATRTTRLDSAAGTTRGATAPVRIGGAASRYRGGGFRVNV